MVVTSTTFTPGSPDLLGDAYYGVAAYGAAPYGSVPILSAIPDTLGGYQLTVGVTHLGDAVEAGEYNVGASFGALSAVGPDVL